MSSKRKRKDDDSPNDDSPNGKSKTNRTTVDNDVTYAALNDLTFEEIMEKRDKMFEKIMEERDTMRKSINFFRNKNITHLIVMENQTRLVEEIKRIVFNNDLSHIQRVDLIRTIVHGATVADYYLKSGVVNTL